MTVPNIEKIKAEYTDKYVVVDENRPELARFKDVVGQVKTVNMSGRALVEFGEYHLNIGWYDIDLDFLKVVDKPEPKVEEKKPAAKKAAPAKPAAKKEAPAKPAKSSTADILAAARGGDGGAKPKASTADILAAARGGDAAKKADAPAAAEPAKPAAKMSTADILAAARGGDAEAKAAPEPAAEPEPTPEPVAEAPPAEEPAAEAPAEDGVVKVDRSSMSVDDMLAYCREKDAE